MLTPRRSLSLRLAIAVLAFVAIGSIALVAWLQFEERRESRAAFLATARSLAQFVRSQRLPASERTAEALSEVLGVEVFFGRRGGGILPDSKTRLESDGGEALASALKGEPGEVRASAKGEAVKATLDDDAFLLLFRTAPNGGGLWGFRTFAVLGAFWALSLALALSLAQGIVRPLRSLAQRLPRIADESAGSVPEARRDDEIGQLARAYEQTHAQLAEERRARQQAERLATLGRIATGLAHEINNPVAAIKLHAQLLEGGITSTRAQSSGAVDSLAIILAENAKIEALVAQWMFLARPQPPVLAPCDPVELVASVLRIHAPAADHARVRIVNEMQSGPMIEADSRRLGQAIGNVVINAIQAMAATGGTLTVTTAVAPQSRGGDPRPVVVVSFADTGPGFSAAALTRHAELFFSEKEGGMGVGLNVSAEILRAHGGELRVANSPGGGATVALILPLAALGIPKS